MSQYNFRDKVALYCLRGDMQVEDIEELFSQGIAMIFILNEKKKPEIDQRTMKADNKQIKEGEINSHEEKKNTTSHSKTNKLSAVKAMFYIFTF